MRNVLALLTAAILMQCPECYVNGFDVPSGIMASYVTLAVPGKHNDPNIYSYIMRCQNRHEYTQNVYKDVIIFKTINSKVVI